MGLIDSKRAQRLYDQVRKHRKNCRFDDIYHLLLALGFTARKPRSGSSHWTFTRGSLRITVPEHRPVGTVYVDRLIAMIENA
jgi:hypothetical protein